MGWVASIPFRQTSDLTGAYLFWVGLITVVLLAFTAMVLFQAKRRGLLKRWSEGWLMRPVQEGQAWASSSQRVSRNVVVHTLERRGHTLVVVESATGVSVTSLGEPGNRAGGGGQ